MSPADVWLVVSYEPPNALAVVIRRNWNFTAAAKLLECEAEQVDYKSGKFTSRGNRKSVSLSDVVKSNGAPVTVSVDLEVPRKGSSTSFVAQVAEVEVDRETGRVKLHKFVTAHDVGTIINPLGHQGQIDGEAIMAIGSGLVGDAGWSMSVLM